MIFREDRYWGILRANAIGLHASVPVLKVEVSVEIVDVIIVEVELEIVDVIEVCVVAVDIVDVTEDESRGGAIEIGAVSEETTGD